MPRAKIIPENEQALSVAEFAAQLRVSQNKVLEWIEDEELKAVNVGRRTAKRKTYRILRSDALTFIELRRTGFVNATPKPVKRRAEREPGFVEYIR